MKNIIILQHTYTIKISKSNIVSFHNHFTFSCKLRHAHFGQNQSQESDKRKSQNVGFIYLFNKSFSFFQ